MFLSQEVFVLVSKTFMFFEPCFWRQVEKTLVAKDDGDRSKYQIANLCTIWMVPGWLQIRNQITGVSRNQRYATKHHPTVQQLQLTFRPPSNNLHATISLLCWRCITPLQTREIDFVDPR